MKEIMILYTDFDTRTIMLMLAINVNVGSKWKWTSPFDTIQGQLANNCMLSAL